VVRAGHVMHGKTSPVTHDGAGLFAGLPSPFRVTRYHSLIVEQESLPDALEVTATSDDGVIMGLSHRTLPVASVQFHPEAVLTEHGHRLLENFLAGNP
jgi:anthranilate synthase component II